MTDFRKLWTAGAFSSLGDSLGGTAYFFLALTVTHSPWFAGLFGGTSLAMRVLVKFPCGYVADHWPRKRLVVIAELLSGLVVLAFAIAVATEKVSATGLLAFAVVAEVPYSLAQVTLSGAVARVVTPSDLGRAISQTEAREHGASALGPLLGGALFGVGACVPIFVDCATFLISALTLSRIRASLDATSEEQSASSGEIWAGFRYALQSKLIRYYVAWTVPANMALMMAFFTVLVVLRTHGASATVTGLVITCGGAAGVLGSMSTPAIIGRFSPTLLVPILSVMMLATGVGLALRPDDHLIVTVLYSSLCLVVPPAQTVLSMRLLTDIPTAIQGRTFSALGIATELAVAPVLPAAGAVVHLFGVSAALWACTVLMAASSSIVFLGRGRLIRAPEGASA